MLALKEVIPTRKTFYTVNTGSHDLFIYVYLYTMNKWYNKCYKLLHVAIATILCGCVISHVIEVDHNVYVDYLADKKLVNY